jgi:hypothetical protein
MVRRCARCRYARTTCRGVLLVGCRAPALRLCPLCCVSPARPATAPLCVRPRCAGGHSAPYRPAILNVARPLLCALAAPRSALLCTSCAPLLRPCPRPLCALAAPVASLRCTAPAEVRRSPVAVRPRCAWGLSAPYCPAVVRARPRCAWGLSARTAPLWCALALAAPGASPHVPPRYFMSLVRCGAPSLRLGLLRALSPAVVSRSSTAMRPRCA